MNHFKKSVLLSAIILITFSAGIVAQDRQGQYEAGLILGEPTGLSFKLWKSDRIGYDAGVAWSFGDNGSLHLHGDYLIHKWLDVESGSLAFYYGLGARARISDNSRFGLRIPVGLQYLIPDSKLGLFFEVVPLFDLAPSTEFDANGGVGIRYFFN